MVVIEEEIYQDLPIDEITILQTSFFRKFYLYKSIRSSVQQVIFLVNENFDSSTNYENLKIKSQYEIISIGSSIPSSSVSFFDE